VRANNGTECEWAVSEPGRAYGSGLDGRRPGIGCQTGRLVRAVAHTLERLGPHVAPTSA
jgi:hypothetical protein